MAGFFRQSCCLALAAAQVREPVTIQPAYPLGRDRSQPGLEKRTGKAIEQAFAALPLCARSFVRDLEICIRMLLGCRTELAICFDGYGSVKNGLPLAGQFIRSARDAATFLAITSPPYVDAESWGLKELQEYEASRQGDQRIFPIERLPLDRDDEYPPALRHLARFKFWTETADRIPVPVPPKSQALCQRLLPLGHQISRHLKQMRLDRLQVAAWDRKSVSKQPQIP
jgi:hypothetical protein